VRRLDGGGIDSLDTMKISVFGHWCGWFAPRSGHLPPALGDAEMRLVLDQQRSRGALVCVWPTTS
jgi:hypothetical protein